jgi:hypothetical protein
MDGSVLTATVPPLPPGAPTLARLLHEMMHEVLNNRGSAALPSCWDHACKALAALPRVEVQTKDIDGRLHWRHESEAWIPADAVHDKVKLEHDLVSRVAGAALQLSASLARFKALTMAEGAALIELLGQQYGIDVGGAKGNVSFFTYDRSYKLQIARADRLTFGPEIHIARELLEQWVSEQPGAAELKALINSAFGLDRQNVVRASEILRLTTLELGGESWARAMDAIKASIRVAGRAEYMRVYRRVGREKYELIPLDLANV